MDDSVRHAALAQYSQRSLQAGRSFRTASSQGGDDLELGTKGSTDAVVDDNAGSSRQGGTPKAGIGRVGTPKNLNPNVGVPAGEEKSNSQRSIKSITGASHKSIGSSATSKSFSIHALGAAGRLSLVIA